MVRPLATDQSISRVAVYWESLPFPMDLYDIKRAGDSYSDFSDIVHREFEITAAESGWRHIRILFRAPGLYYLHIYLSVESAYGVYSQNGLVQASGLSSRWSLEPAGSGRRGDRPLSDSFHKLRDQSCHRHKVERIAASASRMVISDRACSRTDPTHQRGDARSLCLRWRHALGRRSIDGGRFVGLADGRRSFCAVCCGGGFRSILCRQHILYLS